MQGNAGDDGVRTLDPACVNCERASCDPLVAMQVLIAHMSADMDGWSDWVSGLLSSMRRVCTSPIVSQHPSPRHWPGSLACTPHGRSTDPACAGKIQGSAGGIISFIAGQ